MVNLFNNDEFNNIQIERVSAHDGKFPNPVYSKLNLTYKQKNDFEYACLTSHLETVRKFSNTSYETALIMEDDITLEFRPYWRKTVQQVMDEAPEDWEIIQLCYTSVEKDPMYFSTYEHITNSNCVCAAAYLINNKGAKRLMNSIYKNGKYNINPMYNHHADCFLFAMCNTYTYKYPYFIYKTDTSLLHPEDIPDHLKAKIKVVNMYNILTET
jgi:GR25 family glycosyltransferase involved in LPS biosynthesis